MRFTRVIKYIQNWLKSYSALYIMTAKRRRQSHLSFLSPLGERDDSLCFTSGYLLPLRSCAVLFACAYCRLPVLVRVCFPMCLVMTALMTPHISSRHQ